MGFDLKESRPMKRRDWPWNILVGELHSLLRHPHGANATASEIPLPEFDGLQAVSDRLPDVDNRDGIGHARRQAIREAVLLLGEPADTRKALLANFGLLQNADASTRERFARARELCSRSYDAYQKEQSRNGRWVKSRLTRLLELLEHSLRDLPEPDDLSLPTDVLATDILSESTGPVPASKATHLDQTQFYLRLAKAVQDASVRLDLTHHEALPPSLTGIGSKRDYFEAMEAKTLADSIPIRRIVAIPTHEKLEVGGGVPVGTVSGHEVLQPAVFDVQR